jgi:hypothetical protein
MTKEFYPQDDNPKHNDLFEIFIVIKKLLNISKLVTDEQINAAKKKYWKCSSCGEVLKMDMENCRKCGVLKPAIVEHPGDEELRKVLHEKNKITLIWGGFIIIIIGSGMVLILDLIWNFDEYEGPSLFTIVLIGFNAIVGIVLIITGLFRKIFHK